MKFRNPYDSILVLKAVIQEIMDQVGRSYNADELKVTSLVEAQVALDELSYRVEFRGTPLYKLISIVVANRSYQDSPTLDFMLRPLSEDGRVYLRLLEQADAPGTKLKAEEINKVHVRRIVEI